jgi:hypothetical protein
MKALFFLLLFFTFKAFTCDCPDEYRPVCGDDREEYYNACEAVCSGIKKYSIGACNQEQGQLSIDPASCLAAEVQRYYPTRPINPFQNRYYWRQIGLRNHHRRWWEPRWPHNGHARYPAIWDRLNNGVKGQDYPDKGEVMFYKPNIYIKQGIEEEIKVKLGMASDSYLFSSVPMLNNDTWDVKVNEGNFYVDGIQYSYLFYDFRANLDKITLEEPYCGAKLDIINEAKKFLSNANFPSKAVTDFNEHWQVKIPDRYLSYCMYLVAQEQMGQIVSIETNKEVLRVNFIIVPNDELGQVSSEKPFTSFLKGKSEAVLFEWGVGFLTNKGYRRLVKPQ